MPLRRFSSFKDDAGGNVAIVFGLAMVPIIFAAGTALDYGRATNLRTKLQAAVDSTLLNLCQADATLTQTQLQQIAEKSITGFLPNASVDPVVVSNSPRQIILSARATYETAFARVAGVNDMPLGAKGACQAEERYFEIALSVDTTGSMNVSGGSMTKIEALRRAATEFVNFVYKTDTLKNHTKISLVPFSSAVAVDPQAYRNATWIDQNGASSLHWQNISGAAAASFKSRLDIFTKLRNAYLQWDWAGCFESLPYPLNVEDGRPDVSRADSFYVPMFAPDEAGNGGEHWRKETSSGSYQLNPNSYIDDNSTSAGTCTTTPPDDRTRMVRACKYAHYKGADSTNAYGAIGPNWACRSRPLTRLTNNSSKLLSEIAALRADGNTNIHEGTMWGWRTLSPRSVFGDGVPYEQKNTTKVLVLMTDGMNTWGANPYNSVTKSYYSAYGYFRNADGSAPNARLPASHANPSTEEQARAAMDALTKEACRNAAKAGVIIYTIGFSVPNDPIDQQGLNLLRDCAGAPERFFVANDATALIAAFQKIAQSIGTLRLTQ